MIFLLLQTLQTMSQSFDWQGHRGARGIMPENSLPAFEKALELNVKTLEMDVVISADSLVVVSHDPFFASGFCLDPAGNRIPERSREQYNLFQMDYSEIKKYDCGSLGNTRFPDQMKIKVHKPLLTDVFKMAEKYCKDHHRNEIYYNIEIKSQLDWEGTFQPDHTEFCHLVFKTIDAYVPWKRVTIQSFDIRILQYFHKNYPNVRLALLEEFEANAEKSIDALGFEPEIYSPAYRLLRPKTVKWLHDKGIKVIPWTVNSIDEMRALIDMGVDGIITDYPNYISKLAK